MQVSGAFGVERAMEGSRSRALLASRAIAGSGEVYRGWSVGASLGCFWPREQLQAAGKSRCGRVGSGLGRFWLRERNWRQQGRLEMLEGWLTSRGLLAPRMQLRGAGRSRSWRVGAGLGRFWPREQLQAAGKSRNWRVGSGLGCFWLRECNFESVIEGSREV